MQDQGLSAELAALDSRINALLPSQYQHCYTSVSPDSMGSAGIRYGADGRVAWDQIWTTFCDLALAGGPPHRGKLLEPVTETAVATNPERSAEVISEIERAIGLTTSLPVVGGYAPGWVGVRCSSTEEAAWLQFAVTAENVSARRRQAVLQLPAGPDFQVEKEIKNVVVALAKAYHYWDGHLTAAQQSLGGDDLWEPATPTESLTNAGEYQTSIVQVETSLRATGRPTLPRRYAGWVGVATANEKEAVWLLRAVLAARVLVRREGKVLYFPVGTTPGAGQADRVGQAFVQACRLWAVSPESRSS